MKLTKLKIINPKKFNKFITSTPIVLYEDNLCNKFFSFKNYGDLNFFWDRLKDNSIKKYNAYMGDDFFLEGNLFKNFEFGREVSVRIVKNNKSFIMIGSLWKELDIEINNKNKNFYKFLLDCGLGEKNSLGFGMLNDIG